MWSPFCQDQNCGKYYFFGDVYSLFQFLSFNHFVVPSFSLFSFREVLLKSCNALGTVATAVESSTTLWVRVLLPVLLVVLSLRFVFFLWPLPSVTLGLLLLLPPREGVLPLPSPLFLLLLPLIAVGAVVTSLRRVCVAVVVVVVVVCRVSCVPCFLFVLMPSTSIHTNNYLKRA